MKTFFSIICEIKGDIDAKRCNLQAPVSVCRLRPVHLSVKVMLARYKLGIIRCLELITYCFCIEPAADHVMKQSDLREGEGILGVHY